MADQRLPIVDSDDGTWGEILNQFLYKEHYDTGLNDSANGGHKTVTLRPGNTAAGSAPLKFSSGDLMTAPEAGAIEYYSGSFYIRGGTDALSVVGNITGNNLSGTNTGDQTTVSGNAGSATVLQTARNINGISFNGSADITVPTLPISSAPTTQTGQGTIVAITYGESITIGAALYAKSDGTVCNADMTSIATGKIPCMGIALATASSGSHDVLLVGTYKDSTKWTGGTALTVGGMCYLSTSGGITQTQPSSTDNVIQVLGIAIASDTILFKPTYSYITHT
jgi:hypothetical protein